LAYARDAHQRDIVLRATTRVWSPAEIPFGIVVAIVGLWAALVPLIGPYFSFGFDTSDAWVFSEPHVTLSLVPGIAAVAAGLLIALPERGPSNSGRALAAVAGIWFLIGPSLHPILAGEGYGPHAAEDWKRALLWIGYFYGVGAVITFVAGHSRGLVTLRRRVAERQVAEPQFERTVTEG
jgi:hypothetical protein